MYCKMYFNFLIGNVRLDISVYFDIKTAHVVCCTVSLPLLYIIWQNPPNSTCQLIHQPKIAKMTPDELLTLTMVSSEPLGKTKQNTLSVL